MKCQEEGAELDWEAGNTEVIGFWAVLVDDTLYPLYGIFILWVFSVIVFAGALQNPDMLEIAGYLASFQKESLFLHKKQVMSWIQEDHFRWMDRLWPRSLKQTNKKSGLHPNYA